MKAWHWLYTSFALVAVLATGVSAQSNEVVENGNAVISHTGTEATYRNIQLEAKLYEVYEKWVEEPYTWTEWECDYVPGEGRGDWKNFYNVPKDRKPAALAAAIKGIGDSRARDIVESNSRYFEPKPRTWEAFKNEIAKIERDLRMYGIYNDVVIRYGDENYHNLGYAPSSSSGSGTQTPGDGSKGDWKDFYNVPKSQKPTALSNAIRGIGKSTAEQIVESNRGYFEPKPRSWEAFKDEIRRIERELNIPDLYENVVARYGSDNKHNLGYGPSGYTPPSNPGYVCRLVNKSGTQWVKKTDKRYVRSYSKNIDVVVSGSSLLQGETDRIIISYDGRNVSFSAGDYNQYRVSETQRDIYELVGHGRKKVNPNHQDFHFSLSKNAGNLYLNVEDKRANELMEHSANYAVNVSFVLVKKAGRCKKDTVIVNTTQTLAGGSGQIELTPLASEAFEVGETYFIEEISFERLNSNFFSGSSAKAKSTDLIF